MSRHPVAEPLLHIPAVNRPGRSFMRLEEGQRRAVDALNERIASGGVPFEEVDCLCGSRGFTLVASCDRYGIAQPTVVCVRCGLLQSNPRMNDSAYRAFYASDEYRRIYEGEDFIGAAERHYTDGSGEEIFAMVTAERDVATISSLLEFGAASGWNLVPFRRAGVSATGYDYSAELVALGRGHGLDLRQGGIEEVDGEFDVIVLSHVIEHLTDVPGSLRKLASHLRPGGLFWVEVPDIENFYLAQLQNAHTYYFTRRTLVFAAALADLRATRQRRLPNGHMCAVLVPDAGVEAKAEDLDGHFEEMSRLFFEFQRSYRREALVRAAVRALDAVRLMEPVRRVVRAAASR